MVAAAAYLGCGGAVVAAPICRAAVFRAVVSVGACGCAAVHVAERAGLAGAVAVAACVRCAAVFRAVVDVQASDGAALYGAERMPAAAAVANAVNVYGAAGCGAVGVLACESAARDCAGRTRR